MKIKINGNVATFVSNIQFKSLEEATAVAPLFIKNETGKKILGVETGVTGIITDAGIKFAFANADGYACLNACFDPEMTTDEIKDIILDEFGAAINKFDAFESAINEAIRERSEARAELASHIEIG